MVMIIILWVILLFLGLIVDKIGYIIMMIVGLFLRGIGFIVLGICFDFYIIFIFFVFIGFGIVFYEFVVCVIFGL